MLSGFCLLQRIKVVYSYRATILPCVSGLRVSTFPVSPGFIGISHLIHPSRYSLKGIVAF